MNLLSYTFERPEYDQYKWNPLTIDTLEFNAVNLLVGNNASGKSTVATGLANTGRILNGTKKARYIGSRKIRLSNIKGDLIEYNYCGESKGIKESLVVNGVEYLSRDYTSAKIFSIVKNDFDIVNPPNDKVVSDVRRDKKEYPYLEDLVHWAEGVFAFKFGHVHANSFLTELDNDDLTSVKEFNKIIGDLSEASRRTIIEEFNTLGYNVILLDIRKEGVQNILYVKENNIKYEIRQNSLSQGMFRSLSLIIYIHFLIEKENASLIIIDDLCEGLDYDRSTKLGKLLFEKMLAAGVQLLVTSNDYFLMNVVEINYWNIVYRDGYKIRNKNYSTHKERFDEFKLTGLSNFDLFSSNFLSNNA